MALQLIINVAQVGLIFPISLRTSRPDKLLAATIIIVFILGYSYIIYGDYDKYEFYSEQPFIVTFIEYVRILLLIATSLEAIFSCKFGKLEWLKLFLASMRRSEQLLHIPKRNYYLYLFVFVGFSTTIAKSSLFGWLIAKFYTASALANGIFELLLIFHLGIIKIILIALMYLLNNYLTILNEQLSVYCQLLTSRREFLTSYFAKPLIDNVKKLNDAYDSLCDATFCFNKLFGFTLFLSILTAVIDILIRSDKLLFQKYYTAEILLRIELWLICGLLLADVTILAHYGEKIRSQFIHIGRYSDKMLCKLRKLDVLQKGELQYMFERMTYNPTGYIAAGGFFPLDHSLIYNLANMIVTYLIVFAQYSTANYLW